MKCIFNQFLLFEIKHPYLDELDCHHYSGMNIWRGNVHQCNNSSNTGVALLQVSKTRPGFCSQAQQHTLKRDCGFPHAVSLQRNAPSCLCSVCADPEEIWEWFRPADATGIGLGMSHVKSSWAIQKLFPVPILWLHKQVLCQSSISTVQMRKELVLFAFPVG